LKVAGNNTTLLVVASSIAGEFKNLSREVFEDGSEVNRSGLTKAEATVGLSKVATNTTDRELEAGFDGFAL